MSLDAVGATPMDFDMPVRAASAPAAAPTGTPDRPAAPPPTDKQPAPAVDASTLDYGAMPWEAADAPAPAAGDAGKPAPADAPADGDAAAADGRTLPPAIIAAHDAFVTDHPDMKDVADTVLDQIKNPDAIIEDGQFTCSAALVQRNLATLEPEKYWNAAIDLMTKGSTDLPNGTHLEVSADNKSQIDAKQGASTNTRVDLAFQAALMDYGNGADQFSIQTGRSTKDDGSSYKGLTDAETQHLMQTVLGAPMRDITDIEAGAKQAGSVMDYMKQLLKQNPGGVYVPIDLRTLVRESLEGAAEDLVDAPMDYGRKTDAAQYRRELANQMAHLVQVTGIDAQGNVTYRDPRDGVAHTLDQGTFQEMLYGGEGSDIGSGGGTATQGTGLVRGGRG